MQNNPRIILASKSKARRSMLKDAGIECESIPANIDETAIQTHMRQDGYAGPGMALELAKQKALNISQNHADALVIGSDQTLEMGDTLFNKAHSQKEAREKLIMLRGEEHTLTSTVSIAYNGESIWQYIDDAHLKMHNFDDAFLDHYCENAGDALTHCVGAYEIEGNGSWLFSSVKGDYFTILGMPLLPLLAYLRTHHGVIPWQP